VICPTGWSLIWLSSALSKDPETVIASEAKQSSVIAQDWIVSSRSLSSGAHSRDPLAPRNDGLTKRSP
jgi:hypothetical protein